MTLAFEVVNVTDLDSLPPVPLALDPPMVSISGQFWRRGELREGWLLGPVEPAGGAGASATAPRTEVWFAGATRDGLVVLDTNGDRRFTAGDHLLDAGRGAWTTPPDELFGAGEAVVETQAAGAFAFRLRERERGGEPAEWQPEEAGSASSDWFS